MAALADKPWPLLAAILAEQHQVLADRSSSTRHLMRRIAAVAGELFQSTAEVAPSGCPCHLAMTLAGRAAPTCPDQLGWLP